jgi:hypothetical protein
MDTSRTVILALLIVGIALAVFYMIDPTLGGMMGKRESFQDTMVDSTVPGTYKKENYENGKDIKNAIERAMAAVSNKEGFQNPMADQAAKNAEAIQAAQKAISGGESFANKDWKKKTGDAVKEWKTRGAKKGNEHFMNEEEEDMEEGMEEGMEGFLSAAQIARNNAAQAKKKAAMGNVPGRNMGMEGFLSAAQIKSKNAAQAKAKTKMGNVPGRNMGMEGFADYSPEASPFPESQAPANCYPKNQLAPQELLPMDTNSTWAEVNPTGAGDISGKNFLSAGSLIGVNTVGQSLRNANQQLRSEPPNPQGQVSIWNQSTIEPDLGRRPLEGF